MIHLKQAVIVEGKYDKIKLAPIVDALIITTDGFGIFKDKEKIELIKRLARTNGIVILTDSDRAGFKIRNYIKSFVRDGMITNVFIPDILGKEKRKAVPSKEGKLGVEGIDAEILRDAIEKSGLGAEASQRHNDVSRIMLFDDGFIGKNGAEQKRRMLLKELNLPEAMSANTLLEVLNTIYTLDDYRNAVEKIKE